MRTIHLRVGHSTIRKQKHIDIVNHTFRQTRNLCTETARNERRKITTTILKDSRFILFRALALQRGRTFRQECTTPTFSEEDKEDLYRLQKRYIRTTKRGTSLSYFCNITTARMQFLSIFIFKHLVEAHSSG